MAIRWLSGEYSTKTEARQDLGVRTIIEDEDDLRLPEILGHVLSRMAGYSGLIVNIDEMGVLSHRLNNVQPAIQTMKRSCKSSMIVSRAMFPALGFIFAGTDEFLKDQRRGLASYDALDRKI